MQRAHHVGVFAQLIVLLGDALLRGGVVARQPGALGAQALEVAAQLARAGQLGFEMCPQLALARARFTGRRGHRALEFLDALRRNAFQLLEAFAGSAFQLPDALFGRLLQLAGAPLGRRGPRIGVAAHLLGTPRQRRNVLAGDVEFMLQRLRALLL